MLHDLYDGNSYERDAIQVLSFGSSLKKSRWREPISFIYLTIMNIYLFESDH